MSDIKTRMYKTKTRARKSLVRVGYRVTFLSDGVFDIEAVRESEMRKIKICLDAITPADRHIVSLARFPAFCRKEIWCRKPNLETFEIIEIRNHVKG